MDSSDGDSSATTDRPTNKHAVLSIHKEHVYIRISNCCKYKLQDLPMIFLQMECHTYSKISL